MDLGIARVPASLDMNLNLNKDVVSKGGLYGR